MYTVPQVHLERVRLITRELTKLSLVADLTPHRRLKCSQ